MTLVPWSDEEIDIENLWRATHDLGPLNVTQLIGETFTEDWQGEPLTAWWF